MIRTLVLTGVCGLLFSAGQAGDGPPVTGSKRAELEVKLKNLIAKWGPKHPDVADLRREIDLLAEQDQPISKHAMVVFSKHNIRCTLESP